MFVRVGAVLVVTGGFVVGCSSSSSNTSGAGGPSAADASAGDSDGGGTGGGGDGGGGGSGNGSGDGPVLPEGTLLYQRHKKSGDSSTDAIIARDLATGSERVVTDLTGDGSKGWEIWGFSLSPNRRRIALASLYGPTKEDTATGLATRAIWTLATDGTDFRRLTPTVPNDSGGRSSFSHEVGGPEWNADGSRVIYDFGTYWYEGGSLKGGSFPWSVATTGGAVPSPLATPTDCGQVIHPSRNPVTGELLFLDEICIPGQGEGAGLYLYPEAGTETPKKIVASAHTDGSVDIFLAKPAWFPDGSGFAFIGGVTETSFRPSLLVYDAKTAKISLVVAAAEGTSIESVAIAPDTSKAVYCLRQSATNAEDLHLLDLKADPVTDTPITTDGTSSSPSF